MKRQPEGIPAGGQFAPERKAEPAGSLSSSAPAPNEPNVFLDHQAGMDALRDLVNDFNPRESTGQLLADAWALEKAESHLTIRQVAQLWVTTDSHMYSDRGHARMFSEAVTEAYDEHQRARYRDALEPPARGQMSSNEHLDELSYYWQEKGLLERSKLPTGNPSNRNIHAPDIPLGRTKDGGRFGMTIRLERHLGSETNPVTWETKRDQWQFTAHGSHSEKGNTPTKFGQNRRYLQQMEAGDPLTPGELAHLDKVWEQNHLSKSADSEDVGRALTILAKAKAAARK